MEQLRVTTYLTFFSHNHSLTLLLPTLWKDQLKRWLLCHCRIIPKPSFSAKDAFFIRQFDCFFFWHSRLRLGTVLSPPFWMTTKWLLKNVPSHVLQGGDNTPWFCWKDDWIRGYQSIIIHISSNNIICCKQCYSQKTNSQVNESQGIILKGKFVELDLGPLWAKIDWLRNTIFNALEPPLRVKRKDGWGVAW